VNNDAVDINNQRQVVRASDLAGDSAVDCLEALD
jgi:hypothetical protein